MAASSVQELVFRLRDPKTTAEERARTLDALVEIMQKERDEHPEQYEASLKLLKAFLEEVKKLVK